MPRTLSSSQTKSTPARQSQQAHDLVLAILWSRVAELFMIGGRYHTLAPAREKLNAQLNRPHAVYRDGYAEALQRFAAWTSELQGHEMRLGSLLANLAKHYSRLTERNRIALVANEGWSRALDPDQMAREMWERAKTGHPMPEGEPPFDLAPLVEWLSGQMERERQQIAVGVGRLFRDECRKEA